MRKARHTIRVSLRRVIRLDSRIETPPTIQQIINNNAADGKQLCVSAGRRQRAAVIFRISHFAVGILHCNEILQE
jgi:hypothetical protein